MAFRLTVLLCAGIFLAMYFAPDAPPRSAAPVVAGTAPVAAPVTQPETVPETVPVTVPEAPPERPLDTPVTPAETETRNGAQDSAQAEGTGPNRTTLSLPGLSVGGSDAADALSLSEAVRNRTPDAAQRATDELLQGLIAVSPAEPAPPQLPQPTDPNPPPATQTAFVTATSVNLRAGPSTSDPVVGRVNFGDEVALTAPFADGWASIEHPDTGQEVFMASRFLQIQP